MKKVFGIGVESEIKSERPNLREALTLSNPNVKLLDRFFSSLFVLRIKGERFNASKYSG